MCWAHSKKGQPPENWQPLRQHLENVAARAAEFAAPFGANTWAFLAGLWHDLGKYSNEFQKYLESQSEACAESLPGRVDHSSAGAQYSVEKFPISGHILGYSIAGHHSGLLDGRAIDACQEHRLRKEIPLWKHGLTELPSVEIPILPTFLGDALAAHDAFSVAFFVRMVFSCLVDADFLDTEQHFNPHTTAQRQHGPTITDLIDPFYCKLLEVESRAQTTPLGKLRRQIRQDCEQAAEMPPGFFSLTVPTGGGKTLSSLAFALNHSRRFQLRRVLYVLPFTTIIEQNAAVFRRFLGNDAVLEHHSNLDPNVETQAARLAAENWDSPLIVTTSVQFYESIFASRPAACRKLHRLARSVIILDEAQTLPVEYLAPCLQALKELVNNYGCTVVLCTATQPEIRHSKDFDIGLDNIREIIPEPQKLYQQLKRVEVTDLGVQTDAKLSERLLKEEKILCIVNTTTHARRLYESLGPAKGHFHLSARMCPAHRRLRLWQIRRALAAGTICRVVSTQVMEAGVDIDFPIVYRAMAGLDSITQAAGRCNRNNALGRPGQLFLFTSEHVSANRYFADTANMASQVLNLYPDPLSLDANEQYFRLYYWDQKLRWDLHHIMDNFHLEQNRAFPFNFSFSKTAQDFHLIDDASGGTVLIPWNQRSTTLCEKLRAMPEPTREILRLVQPFAVRVKQREWERHAQRDIHLIYDNLGILESPETHYSPQTGLNLEAEGPGYYIA